MSEHAPPLQERSVSEFGIEGDGSRVVSDEGAMVLSRRTTIFPDRLRVSRSTGSDPTGCARHRMCALLLRTPPVPACPRKGEPARPDVCGIGHHQCVIDPGPTSVRMRPATRGTHRRERPPTGTRAGPCPLEGGTWVPAEVGRRADPRSTGRRLDMFQQPHSRLRCRSDDEESGDPHLICMAPCGMGIVATAWNPLPLVQPSPDQPPPCTSACCRRPSRAESEAGDVHVGDGHVRRSCS